MAKTSIRNARRFAVLACVALPASCADAPPVTVPPESLAYNAPALLAGRAPLSATTPLRNNTEREEILTFRSGSVAIVATPAGRKLNDSFSVQVADRAAFEPWARQRLAAEQLGEMQPPEAVQHARFGARGWMASFATATPGKSCAVARATYAMRSGNDDRGFFDDTFVFAMACQMRPGVPDDLRRLMNGIAPRAP